VTLLAAAKPPGASNRRKSVITRFYHTPRYIGPQNPAWEAPSGRATRKEPRAMTKGVRMPIVPPRETIWEVREEK